MSHKTAGEFEALLADLVAVQSLRDQGALPQRGGDMRKALPMQPRQTARASRPALNMAATMAELDELQRRTSSLKNDANAQLQMSVGERRARLEVVADALDRRGWLDGQAALNLWAGARLSPAQREAEAVAASAEGTATLVALLEASQRPPPPGWQ